MRHQLPGYSPLDLGSLLRAQARAMRDPREAEEDLRHLLVDRFQARRAILFGSGTQSLQAALGIGKALSPGRPVALPAYSCFDLVTAAVGAGTEVVFYDVDPATLAPDMDSVRTALGHGAGTLVAGNLFGFPLDPVVLRAAADEAGAILVEDAAQGVGSTWDGREGGTFGDLTILSFARGKGWTGGGGGALLVRGERVMDAVERYLDGNSPSHRQPHLRTTLASAAQWSLGRPALYGIPRALPGLTLGETVYHEPGPLRAMAPFSAALVLETAEASRVEIRARVVNAERWSRDLQRITEERGTVASIPGPLGGSSSYLRFPLLARSAATVRILCRELERHGVAPGYPVPLPELKVSSGLMVGGIREDHPGARELAARLVTLPTHSLVQDRDRAAILAFLDREIPS